ncbi:hypothetical protein [Mesonia sp. K4-1]|uniref:hypothetical protein n=1 Tax=Mesonia sp. K4-1 TaxID=2602760 RepID=UPI0011CA14CA|nr:hypothetical protein [Mesonia sp. K4-1]TXK78607.1 hypothetical protein FT986_02105 [Mesonia sp. K4-1]
MKKVLFIVLSLIIFQEIAAQNNVDSSYTENVFRINFLNPGVEYEYAVTNTSTLSGGLGVTYGGSYPDLSGGGSGFRYLITPFLDLQYKHFYNFKKRLAKNKNTAHNSGNFISGRFYTRGETIESNFDRTSNYDFAVGPTWGLQRSYGKFHLLFDVGTIYYFDTKGNGNWFPIMIQLNIGLNL